MYTHVYVRIKHFIHHYNLIFGSPSRCAVNIFACICIYVCVLPFFNVRNGLVRAYRTSLFCFSINLERAFTSVLKKSLKKTHIVLLTRVIRLLCSLLLLVLLFSMREKKLYHTSINLYRYQSRWWPIKKCAHKRLKRNDFKSAF